MYSDLVEIVEQALNRIKHILAYNPKVKDLNIKHYKTIIDFREKYKWNQKINKWVLWQDHPKRVQIAPTTIEKELICLRTALNYAVKKNWITKNYLPNFPEDFRDKVTAYKNSAKDIYFSTAEVHAIADCMKETSFMLPTLLASVTGLRRNEILSLQWKDWTQEPVMNDSTNEKIMVHFLQVKRSLFYDDNKKQWTVIKADGTINPPKTPASDRTISLGYCGEDNFAVRILEEQKKIQHANNIKVSIYLNKVILYFPIKTEVYLQKVLLLRHLLGLEMKQMKNLKTDYLMLKYNRGHYMI
jgi:hypothetical protein